MRNFARTLSLIAVVLAFTGLPALAQTKIGTVDLKRLFDNYYKTKLATQAIQGKADDLDKDYANMTAEFKKQNDQYEQAMEAADDPAVSTDERQRRKQTAADQLKQLQDRKAAIEQFQRQAQMTLSDQRQRMRDSILDEIKAVVSQKAKAAGDTLVLDTAAQTANGTPAIIFTSGDNDLTDDVLKQLNAGAPTDIPDNSTAPIFMSTNSLPYNSLPGSTMPGSQ
jgi:outer membrane protein